MLGIQRGMVFVANLIGAGAWVLMLLAVFGWRHTDTKVEANEPERVGSAVPDQTAGDRNVQPLSKAFYLGSIFGGFGVSLLMIFIAVLALATGDDDVAPVGVGIACCGYLPGIYGMVILAILIYKIWAPLQDGPARTTPGKAVGFLFIPFFNLYWVFQAYWGWAVDYNKYIVQKQIPGPRMPEGLAMAICILTVCSIIPYLGILISLVSMVLMAIFLNSAINGANAIISARGAGAAGAA